MREKSKELIEAEKREAEEGRQVSRRKGKSEKKDDKKDEKMGKNKSDQKEKDKKKGIKRRNNVPWAISKSHKCIRNVLNDICRQLTSPTEMNRHDADLLHAAQLLRLHTTDDTPVSFYSASNLLCSPVFVKKSAR